MPPRISIIVAAASNNVIGRGGALPWRLPEDLKRFRRLTVGKPVIMGRVTYESIGRPLPDRHNIVLSGRNGLTIEGCDVVTSPDAALALAGEAKEVMIIGGARVYEQMLPHADRIYMTRIDAEIDGDTFFPELDPNDWRVVDREAYAAGNARPLGFTFETLDRIAID